MKKGRKMVTDHALVRYLERVKGVNMSAIRREMLTPTVKAALSSRATTAVVFSGHRFEIKNGSVITVKPT